MISKCIEFRGEARLAAFKTQWISRGGWESPIKFGGRSFQLYAQPVLATFHSWLLPQLPALAPAFSRAWCYQERLVSPRVVYFSREEVLWECFTDTACECSGVAPGIDVDNPKLNHRVDFLEEERSTISSGPMLWRGASIESSSGTESWSSIPSSKLEITNVGDRLPALGAVGREFPTSPEGEETQARQMGGAELVVGIRPGRYPVSPEFVGLPGKNRRGRVPV
ncbi:Uu.00g093120.m01.CDS01 [Anthostomella pinea]|uniref:Uu.00g093120.m01.CDS01 n=1 Tax=Anthostomella pinea TaxID=933095 RepID=A0AAI8VPC7_9PEZI|nr:Uu.00g093120.m01.CDS01 [Anthostomella pinea]